MSKILSDIQIQMIVTTRLRWPDRNKSMAWSTLHNCVDQLHKLVRTVDINCCAIEENLKLNRDEIVNRRAELGNQALIELANLKPFEAAKKAVQESIEKEELGVSSWSDQAQMPQQLSKALEELRRGLASTRQLLLERCKTRQSGVGAKFQWV